MTAGSGAIFLHVIQWDENLPISQIAWASYETDFLLFDVQYVFGGTVINFESASSIKYSLYPVHNLQWPSPRTETFEFGKP